MRTVLRDRYGVGLQRFAEPVLLKDHNQLTDERRRGEEVSYDARTQSRIEGKNSRKGGATEVYCKDRKCYFYNDRNWEYRNTTTSVWFFQGHPGFGDNISRNIPEVIFYVAIYKILRKMNVPRLRTLSYEEAKDYQIDTKADIEMSGKIEVVGKNTDFYIVNVPVTFQSIMSHVTPIVYDVPADYDLMAMYLGTTPEPTVVTEIVPDTVNIELDSKPIIDFGRNIALYIKANVLLTCKVVEPITLKRKITRTYVRKHSKMKKRKRNINHDNDFIRKAYFYDEKPS